MTEFYKTIPGENMFDFEDYYSSVAERLPDMCRVCEVGNADGRSAIFLAEKLRSLGKGFKMHMVDSMDYGGRDQFETIFRNVQEAGFSNEILVVWKDSLAASCKVPDEYFDFVFLDSSHEYEETKAELLLWSRKVRSPGWFAGHDYTNNDHPGVHQAVNEITILKSVTFRTYITRNELGVWEFKF